jgi:dTDP-4-dehydrorhamnose 3,5-epimerase
VRVLQGEILDVGRFAKFCYLWTTFSVILSGEKKKQLMVPHGFAHGF